MQQNEVIVTYLTILLRSTYIDHLNPFQLLKDHGQIAEQTLIKNLVFSLMTVHLNCIYLICFQMVSQAQKVRKRPQPCDLSSEVKNQQILSFKVFTQH